MLSATCQHIKEHAVKGEAHSEQIGLKRDPEHVSEVFRKIRDTSLTGC